MGDIPILKQRALEALRIKKALASVQEEDAIIDKPNLEAKSINLKRKQPDREMINRSTGGGDIMKAGDALLPRKPKYINRVHTGYEWNAYNRTHHDCDNPPPKFVQGYKLNIFYSDLVDKSKVPTYTFEKDGYSTETCIIRFHAGPPYEDIAFRIVNKEWEKGSKCTFKRGILQVHFNFNRYRYRR